MSESKNASLVEMAARIREMREIIGYSVEQMAEVASRLLSKPLFANLADIGMEE